MKILKIIEVISSYRFIIINKKSNTVIPKKKFTDFLIHFSFLVNYLLSVISSYFAIF